MKYAAIGIDLGGTRIKGVAMDPEGVMIEHLYTPTEDNSSQLWKTDIKKTVHKLQEKVKGHSFVIGISAPGIPNEGNTAISFMPERLQGLEGFNWSEFLNHKTFVANDAIAALAAEARYGEAMGLRHVVMLTLGTGVGGAILIDGKVYQGAFQKAGHMGHMTVDSEGENDICNLPGSLEDAIGNCSINKRTLGKYAYTHQLLDDYRRGDPFASWVWLSSVRKLSVAVASLTNILSPQRVILGGGITEAGDDLFNPLESFMAMYEWRAGGNKVEIVKSKFGDLSGAIGAAGFALMMQDQVQ
jgi:glucokinase